MSAAAWTPIPSRPAARHTSTGSPTGSDAATNNSRWVSGGSASSRRRKLSSIRPDRPGASGNPNPPASSAGVNPRGNSNNANGLPCVSATIRSRTRSSNGTRNAELNRARASPLRSPSTTSARQPLELITRITRREHKRDRLRQQPPRHEHERLRRGPIKPVRVINHTQKRLLRGRLREQAQHRQPHQKPIRRVPRTQPERHARARPAEGQEAGPVDPASARTTAATPRTQAPSPTPHRPPASPGTPTPIRSQTPPAPSCQPPARRAPPTPGSAHPARPRAAHLAPRARHAGRATPPPAPQ